ncbi:MmcQ/YjbR family DNA-binding protein [Idiomarina xiamenensis]|uniref:MmcQ/YjbR family DNA-binding protein n=1 Tax=Idiomarina xiamenensis 10-D-4 TaxID=740709 RepID=K2JMH4_9GAMM|nr:MmcQ/YjbR family DNA-binding protein [Idiomarina xiamenensis]EKE84696.1 hypothetical protein A10D4_03760 [Idiomarina xiamenensis 10-D-4]
MDMHAFNRFCATYTAATHVQQWGASQVWKVGGKVFAIGAMSKSGEPAYSFKTSDLNYHFLCQQAGYIPAPYLASRGLKWIQQIATNGELDDDLNYYLSESYRIVATSLSLKKQRELGLVLKS